MSSMESAYRGYRRFYIEGIVGGRRYLVNPWTGGPGEPPDIPSGFWYEQTWVLNGKPLSLDRATEFGRADEAGKLKP